MAHTYQQKPYRRLMMQTWGAKVHRSPSELTEAGRRILQADPSSTGSLGIAISEAVEVASRNEDTKYCLGSVFNHVLLHQTVIGEECIKPGPSNSTRKWSGRTGPRNIKIKNLRIFQNIKINYGKKL